MNGFVPTYCSKCGMRMVPPPNLCACQPAPAEHVQQIIAERDRLRAVNAELLAACKLIAANHPHAGGAISEAQLDWVRSAIARAKEGQS